MIPPIPSLFPCAVTRREGGSKDGAQRIEISWDGIDLYIRASPREKDEFNVLEEKENLPHGDPVNASLGTPGK